MKSFPSSERWSGIGGSSLLFPILNIAAIYWKSKNVKRYVSIQVTIDKKIAMLIHCEGQQHLTKQKITWNQYYKLLFLASSNTSRFFSVKEIQSETSPLIILKSIPWLPKLRCSTRKYFC
jgi:hypothetical protein